LDRDALYVHVYGNKTKYVEEICSQFEKRKTSRQKENEQQ